MKSLDLSRYALSVCLAGTLFVGCGGPQAQSWNAAFPLESSAKRNADMKGAAGGSFNASYAGKYRWHASFEHSSDKYFGGGRGTFIGRSKLRGSGSCGVGGLGDTAFTFRSKKNLADTFSIDVPECLIGDGSNATYTVTGGTGKFANASGEGTVSLYLHPTRYHEYWGTGNFTASFTGTLNF